MVFINNLKGYKIVLTLQAAKDLKKIDTTDAEKIELKLQELVQGSPSLDIKKLEGKGEPTYRLRHKVKTHSYILTMKLLSQYSQRLMT
jgi:hypothetical protein